MSTKAVNDPKTPRPKRGFFVLGVLFVLGAALFAGFIALGTWQVHRRAWKHDLIARVDSRVHAEPVTAPGRAQWPMVSAANDEYRRVKVSGHFLPAKSVRVRASTELGLGSWLMTPMLTSTGETVLVNRGYVSTDWCAGKATCDPGPSGDTTIVGLLRISEPKGAFLQDNQPANGKWFSRDVAAIAQAQGLSDTAPYFIDADAASSPERGEGNGAPTGSEGNDSSVGGEGNDGPVGGLTVIAFPDNHLMYAITWYGLALMTLLCAWIVRREHRKKTA